MNNLELLLKEIKAKKGLYRLGMESYSRINGKIHSKLLTDKNTCETTCCIIGWAANWGIGDTEQYLVNTRQVFDFGTYSHEQILCDYKCDNVNLWDFLFSEDWDEYHGEDWNEAIARVTLVVNEEYDCIELREEHGGYEIDYTASYA